jgi:ATP-dependent RNA helicase DDX54/DBP10
MPKER